MADVDETTLSFAELSALPERKLTFKEIGRVCKYIGHDYLLFFVDLGCPIPLLQHEMEENRHLAFRSQITRVFIQVTKMMVDLNFMTVAAKMLEHGMDSLNLSKVLDCNRENEYKDERLPDEWLKKSLSVNDVKIIYRYIDTKVYFNMFIELGFHPNDVDSFDHQFRNRSTYDKIKAMLETFIIETLPPPTRNTILLAMQECNMDTESLIAAFIATEKDPLVAAVKEGHIAIVRKPLDKGADVNKDPLVAAVEEGHIDIVRKLLDKGADVNKWNILDKAASGGNTDLVRLLLDKGADVNKTKALMAAARGHHNDIIVLLLERASDPEKLTTDDALSECPSDVLEFIFKTRERLRRQQEYRQGILETEETPRNITITVVGHQGVGKSCLVKQLKQEHIPIGGPGSTDTADFYIDFIAYNPDTGFRKTLDENGEIETHQHRLKQLIDKFRINKEEARTEAGRGGEMETVGHQNEYNTEPPDTTHRTETQSKPEPPHQIETRNRSAKKTEAVQFPSATPSQPSTGLNLQGPIMDTGNKTRQDISTEQREVIDQIMETKSKEGEEEVKGFVTVYDFGGERVFYNTHHCFMSSNMVFVLVFDVDMCLDKDRSTAGYEIAEHWLKVIATYDLNDESRGEGIPPIILIGSHLDKVSSNTTTQREMFAKVLDNLRANQQLRSIMEHHVHDVFAIANLNDSSANKDVYEALWQKIIEIAPLQSQWGKAVPARWIAMEHELIRLKNKGHILLKYEELLDVNRKMVVPLVEKEIRKFLRYLKYAGRFLCFNVQTKLPFIVLQPQWVIDGFKQIITDDKFKTALSEEMKFDWESYKRSGILPMDFLKHLWKEDRFHTNEEELRIVMETLNLLATPIPKDQADETNYYIVPSILPNANPKLIEHIVQDPTRVVTITICLKFKKPFIPQAVWDKMIASCIHRFQRLDEPGHDGLNFIQRGFACLKVTSRWNTILNCKDNSMKITLFTKSKSATANAAGKSPEEKDYDKFTGVGVQLLSILEFLLHRILELNHQSHLEYQYYLHNDYRVAADDQMMLVDKLRRTACVQNLDSKDYPWLNKEDIRVWFVQPGLEAPDATEKQNETMITALNLPDRQLTLREIGRISAYIFGLYYPFFVHMSCQSETLEQMLEENRHLDIRSRFTKVLIRLQNTKNNVSFSTMAEAMQRYDMNPSKLRVILDGHRTNAFKDHRTSLHPSDAKLIAGKVSVKMYFNLFVELGFSPEKIDDFDDLYSHCKSREKVVAMLRSFIEDTKPTPTRDTVLQAMQECQMNTSEVIKALVQQQSVPTSSS